MLNEMIAYILKRYPDAEIHEESSFEFDGKMHLMFWANDGIDGQLEVVCNMSSKKMYIRAY